MRFVYSPDIPPIHYGSLLLTILFFTGCASAFGQSFRFSQYQTVPLQTNPAFAGVQSDYSLHLNYRLQNIGLLAYRTAYASFTVPLYDQAQEPRAVGGLAVGAINDIAGEAGEISSNGFSLSGAYSVLFDQYGVHSLTFGLQGEYLMTQIDFGSLNWPSQITYYGFDPGRPATEVVEGRTTTVRFQAGLLWSYNPASNPQKASKGPKIFAGLAVYNLNRPEQSYLQNGDYRLFRLYNLHGGTEIRINDRLSLAPDFLVMLQNKKYQFSAGTLLNLSEEFSSPRNPLVTKINLFAGVWYRSYDAIVVLIGASNRRFNAAFSYDLNALPAKAGIHGQGAVELSLAFRFLKEKEPRKISTPLF